MSKFLRIEFLLVTGLVALLSAVTSGQSVVLGQSPSAVPQVQTAADEQRLQGLETESNSLVEQIAQVQANLAKIEAQRQQTVAQVAKLAADSQALQPAIAGQTADFQRKLGMLKEAITNDYKEQPGDGIELLAESGSLSDALARSSYHGAIEQHLDRLAGAAEQARDELADRKQDLDAKRSTLEVLQRQLTALEQGTAAQQAELQQLLAARQNEAQFLAERVARAKAAQQALLQASGGNALFGTFTDGARLRRGDIVGFEGSTGFSTGCHTHFSVIEKGQWVNPDSYWSKISKPPGQILQPFGWTDWARLGVYHGQIHNGIDFVQGCGSPVRAVADGTVIRDNRSDGSGFGHYVMVRHDDGLISLYAHLI